MGGIAKIAIPLGLGLTGFGLAGMGPLAGVFSSAGEAAGTADALGTGVAAGIGSGGNAALVNYGLLGPTDLIADSPEVLDTAATAISDPNAATATYGLNNEFTGNTIANNGMTYNPYTGGYDTLNGFQRFGQQLGDGFSNVLSGAPDGTNKVLMNGLSQALKMMQPHQVAPVPPNISVNHSGPGIAPLPPFAQISPYALAQQQEQQRLQALAQAHSLWAQRLGQA